MQATLRPGPLRVEYDENPLGIDELAPRFFWELTPTGENTRGLVQSAYRIVVASTPELLAVNHGDLWDTGKVTSDRSVHVVYAGALLKSRKRYHWKVKVWDEARSASEFSAPSWWEMGLLDARDWIASWIGIDPAVHPGIPVLYAAEAVRVDEARWVWSGEGQTGSCRLGREWTLPSDAINSAEFALAAKGPFRLVINEKEAGRGQGGQRLVSMNVKSLLRPGANVFTIETSHDGTMGDPGVIGRLGVVFEDGKVGTLFLDTSWKCVDREAGQPAWPTARAVADYGAGPAWTLQQPAADARRLPAVMVRREIRLRRSVQSARVYGAGLGYFELCVNGKKIGDHVMDPVLSNYDRTVYYVPFDITDQVVPGDNAIGVILGSGRYFAPRILTPTATRTFGYPKVLLQVEVIYDDGSREFWGTDGSWRISLDGPIRANNEYDGEEYDARMELTGWDRSGFDDDGWLDAALVSPPAGELRAQPLEPMGVTEVLAPVSVTEWEPGKWVYDFGQNCYGWARLSCCGPRGATVSLRYAQVVEADGSVNTANQRSAQNCDRYTLSGKGLEVWAPRFSGRGFRYVEVTTTGPLSFLFAEGCVVHSAVETVGDFRCTNPLLNRLYANARWGQRSFLRGVPMDPDRDERQGWLGDPAKDAESEAFNFQVARFYRKWLADIRAEQQEDGALPDVAPAYFQHWYSHDVIWPSVITILPEWAYRFYGDVRMLEANYEAASRWVRFIHAHYVEADDTLSVGVYGDWCDALTASNSGGTSKPLLSTAYHYHNCVLVAQMAAVLGQCEDRDWFKAQAEKIKQGFHRRFFNAEDHTYGTGTQCALVVPLAFSLVPPQEVALVAQSLVRAIDAERGHLSVGLVGMQWVLQVLVEHGYPDVAYRVATQSTQPSWGYMVGQGATTIWEHWDSDTRSPTMNSPNLLILAGNLVAWMYQDLAGLRHDPETPGFQHVLIRPHPVAGLNFAQASYHSFYGQISAAWQIDDDSFRLQTTIPPNCWATVAIPAGQHSVVLESDQPVGTARGIRQIGHEQGRILYRVGSGTYDFSAAPWTWRPCLGSAREENT